MSSHRLPSGRGLNRGKRVPEDAGLSAYSSRHLETIIVVSGLSSCDLLAQ